LISTNGRLRFVRVPASRRSETLAEAVRAGLSSTPKTLPCRYFYDTAGSRLFERICRLPEYYLTRTEQSILERHAGEMIEAMGGPLAMVEFGSGSSCKTRLLLTAALDRQPDLHYAPIDISAEFLRLSAEELLADYDRLQVTAIAAEYADGMTALPPVDAPRLVLFLGSNIGNFERPAAVEFLRRLREATADRDRVLIGVDLVKDRLVLRAAYDDSQGVTAAFNLNLLARVNRELDGRFDLSCFRHHAEFVEEQSRIEMRLVSARRQRVAVGALDTSFSFEEGESIHTENSHKYSLEAFRGLAAEAGFSAQACWTDPREWFAVLLLRPHETV
jgi:dimethylhistidine N-methyltransferase